MCPMSKLLSIAIKITFKLAVAASKWDLHCCVFIFAVATALRHLRVVPLKICIVCQAKLDGKCSADGLAQREILLGLILNP